MDDQLSKWLQGEISTEELKKHVGSDDAVKFQQIVEEVDNWVPDSKNQLFDPEAITNQPKETKTTSISAWLPYSVAASIIMAIAAYFFLFNNSSTVTFSTEIAEIMEVSLPDGSKVHLAPNSEISWDKEDWSQSQVAERVRLKAKRKVKLKGKALFKVKKGNLFTVNTLVGSVEVLGTTFEVNEFADGLNVICFEGKVRATAQKASVEINGGDSYLFYDGEWEEKKSVEETLPGWISGKTTFENAPLSQVIETLETLYKISIEAGSTNIKKRFTGTIPNDNLDVALKIVFDPFNIEYVRIGDTLNLSD